eukprot:s4604_g2.t1
MQEHIDLYMAGALRQANIANAAREALLRTRSASSLEGSTGDDNEGEEDESVERETDLDEFRRWLESQPRGSQAAIPDPSSETAVVPSRPAIVAAASSPPEAEAVVPVPSSAEAVSHEPSPPAVAVNVPSPPEGVSREPSPRAAAAEPRLNRSKVLASAACKTGPSQAGKAKAAEKKALAEGVARDAADKDDDDDASARGSRGRDGEQDEEMEPADESAPADNGSKRKRKADAKKGGKKPRQDARVEPVVEPKLGWDGGEDGLAEGWPVKSIPDPDAPGEAVPEGQGHGRSHPQWQENKGWKASGEEDPVVAGPELNEDWVDKATKKRVLFLMSNIGTSTFEEIKTHLLAHRPEFKKTQLTAYWTRSSVGLKLLLDPCRPQMCTVSFRKDFPNNWNHTMVAAHAVVLKLAEILEECDAEHPIFDIKRIDDPRGRFQTNLAVTYASGLSAIREILSEDAAN